MRNSMAAIMAGAGGQIEGGFGARGERDVLELADVDEVEADAGFGDELGFEAAGGSDEADFGAMFVAQDAGDGEPGDDVAAGAASGDEDTERGGHLPLV